VLLHSIKKNKTLKNAMAAFSFSFADSSSLMKDCVTTRPQALANAGYLMTGGTLSHIPL